jgi:uncharacterized protein YjbJ (UPF0337 family)
MNKDQIAGKWQQVKGEIKQQYAKLGDTDFQLLAEGQKDKFLGRIRELHGDNKEQAEEKLKNIKEWDSCGCSDGSCSTDKKGKVA